VHVVQPLALLLRDDVQPVEVHRLGVADDHGQCGRQVQGVLGGGAVNGLAGPCPIAVVGELGPRSSVSPPARVAHRAAGRLSTTLDLENLSGHGLNVKQKARPEENGEMHTPDKDILFAHWTVG
jgi:hypothetical protein